MGLRGGRGEGGRGEGEQTGREEGERRKGEGVKGNGQLERRARAGRAVYDVGREGEESNKRELLNRRGERRMRR